MINSDVLCLKKEISLGKWKKELKDKKEQGRRRKQKGAPAKKVFA